MSGPREKGAAKKPPLLEARLKYDAVNQPTRVPAKRCEHLIINVLSLRSARCYTEGSGS